MKRIDRVVLVLVCGLFLLTAIAATYKTLTIDSSGWVINAETPIFARVKAATMMYANSIGAYSGDMTTVNNYLTATAFYGGNVPSGDFIARDVKTAGTNGGTFTAGDWVVRDLNTVDMNTISGASINANTISLPAGTYVFRASAPAVYVATHQARLAIISAATIIYGTSEVSYFSGEGYSISGNRSVVSGTFTLASPDTVQVQHKCTSTKADNGLGSTASTGAEDVYTEIQIQRR